MQHAIRSFFKKHLALNIIGLAVVFIVIEGLYSFCSKPKAINCPAFSDANFDSWFPYQPFQKLYFISSLNSKDSFTIASVIKNSEYSSSSGCAMSAQIVSKEVANGTNRLFIDYHNFSNNNPLLTLSLYNSQLNGTLQESSYTPQNASEKSSFAASATINGHTFTNVIEVQFDTTIIKHADIYKFWLSKQNGLVGYERYPSLEQFVKQ